MKVSVIMPVYNVAQEIERCLLSVLDQTWEALEVILVNDCTPDNSMEVAAAVIASHPRGNVVRCVEHKTNKGVFAARNTGIHEATGDYCLFVDSDDFISLDTIALLGNAVLSCDADFAIGQYDVVGQGAVYVPLSLPLGVVDGNMRILEALVHGKWYIMAWNKLIKRSFLLQYALFFQTVIHEDNLWSFKVACLAERIVVVDQVTYHYWMRSNSLTHTISHSSMENRMTVIAYMQQFIEEQKLQNNRLVYILFEREKATSYEYIRYNTNDNEFRFRVYNYYREHRYKKSCRIWPGVKLAVCNLHYYMPAIIGYHYYIFSVKLFYYYMLILPIKLKQWSRWIIRR
jgi:glycosyltransferase involved in cell wall biosynthesis